MNLLSAFFDNPFDDVHITADRLAAFAQDAVERMKTQTAEPFVGLVAALQPPLLQLQTELGDLDTSLQRQKTKTRTADEFMEDFGASVKAAEPVIAAGLGGYESTGYGQFFPQGTREYTQATKKAMPLLTRRLADMAAEFSTRLPADLVAKFTAYPAEWKTFDGKQSASRQQTADKRVERSAARQALELQLLTAVHTVAAAFPGDKKTGAAYFSFPLLRASRFASLKDKGDKPAT